MRTSGGRRQNTVCPPLSGAIRTGQILAGRHACSLEEKMRLRDPQILIVARVRRDAVADPVEEPDL